MSFNASMGKLLWVSPMQPLLHLLNHEMVAKLDAVTSIGRVPVEKHCIKNASH